MPTITTNLDLQENLEERVLGSLFRGRHRSFAYNLQTAHCHRVLVSKRCEYWDHQSIEHMRLYYGEDQQTLSRID